MATWYWIGTLYVSAHGVAYEVYVRADAPVTEAAAAAALLGVKRVMWGGGTVGMLDTATMLVPPGGTPPGGERRLPVVVPGAAPEPAAVEAGDETVPAAAGPGEP